MRTLEDRYGLLGRGAGCGKDMMEKCVEEIFLFSVINMRVQICESE